MDLEHRLDRIESKQDLVYESTNQLRDDVRELREDVKDHLSRLSAAEASIEWLKGHVKIATTLVGTVLAGLAIWFLTGCGREEQPPHPHPIELAPLEEKLEAYEERLLTDEHGFLLEGGEPSCDGTLWAGLIGAPGLLEARNEDGQWFRRPLDYPECYENGLSASTVSRDMLLGVLWWAYENGRQGVAEVLWEYAWANSLIMGQGTPGEVLLTGNTLWLTAELANATISPVPWIAPTEDLTGFIAHLAAVQSLLRANIKGWMDEDARQWFLHQSARSPRNALFAYGVAKWVTGDYRPAVALLMDTKLFPEHKNPDYLNRCEGWLWQRDDKPHDWGPCSITDHRYGIVHHGGDFVFVARLILGDSTNGLHEQA